MYIFLDKLPEHGLLGLSLVFHILHNILRGKSLFPGMYTTDVCFFCPLAERRPACTGEASGRHHTASSSPTSGHAASQAQHARDSATASPQHQAKRASGQTDQVASAQPLDANATEKLFPFVFKSLLFHTLCKSFFIY